MVLSKFSVAKGETTRQEATLTMENSQTRSQRDTKLIGAFPKVGIKRGALCVSCKFRHPLKVFFQDVVLDETLPPSRNSTLREVQQTRLIPSKSDWISIGVAITTYDEQREKEYKRQGKGMKIFDHRTKR